MLLFRPCENLSKVLGLDKGFGLSIYYSLRQIRCQKIKNDKLADSILIFREIRTNNKNKIVGLKKFIVSLHRRLILNNYDSGIQNQEFLFVAG